MKQLQITTLTLLLLTALTFADANHTHDNAKEQGKIVQVTCPVMGGKINKALHSEYKGEKVYFCCDMCIKTFNENPEKYLLGTSFFENTEDDHHDID